MDSRTRIPNRSQLLACLVLLAGCNLSVDPSLIRVDAGAEPDGPVVEEDVGLGWTGPRVSVTSGGDVSVALNLSLKIPLHVYGCHWIRATFKAGGC